MKRTHLYAAPAAALLLTTVLGACGSDEQAAEDPTKSPASATTTPTPTPSPTPSDEESPLSQEELQARIITNAPPKDLMWSPPKAPADWQRLSTPQGSAQWQVGQEPCTVILDQPSGVGDGEEPTSEQVLDREAQRLGDSLKATGEPKTLSDDPVMVANQVVGLDGATQTRFAHRRLDYGNGAQADIRTHRAGDFALIAVVACGQGKFNELFESQIAPFLDKLRARTTY